MEFNEQNLSNYMDGTWKIALVHKKLNNQPILVEAKSFYELNIEKDKVKAFLNNEWTKVEMKQKYDEWANERENILKIALNEAQNLTWSKTYIPFKRFSTNYIKYDKKFRPRAFLNINGQESVHKPTFPKEKKMKKFFYTMIGNDEKVYSLNQEYLKEYQHYQENMRRYVRLRQERKIWDEEYPKIANPKLRKYYLRNPLLIQEQAHKILATSNFCNKYRKQPDYNRKNFYYNVKNQKLSLRYYLPPIESLEDFLKEPNYDTLEWKKCNEEEQKRRIFSIWSQLILIVVYKQFFADKLKLINILYIESVYKEFKPEYGKDTNEKIIVEFSREDFEKKLTFTTLTPTKCIGHYQIQEKKKSVYDERLLSLENMVEDVLYSVDNIEPSINTNIETLNNNDGGVINFRK